jgi:small-conductance mechanosensitive channel
MDLNSIVEQLQGLYRSLEIKLFEIAGTPVTLATLLTFLLIVVATFWFSKGAQKGLARALGLRGITDGGTIHAAGRLMHYVIVAVGLGVALQTVGINLGALFAAGAVLAIGIGFAMQNIAQNFVSGVILLAERTIKPGDVLQIEGQFVRVSQMGIRATIAKTLDDEEIIIPNASIVQGTVKNYTLRDSFYRLRTVVGVTYSSDMRKVRETLERVAFDLPWRSAEKEPVVLLSEFGSSSVNFDVSVWIDDPWRMMRRRSTLNEAIWWALKEADVTIAFPQVDVHFDAPVIESLRRLPGTG